MTPFQICALVVLALAVLGLMFIKDIEARKKKPSIEQYTASANALRQALRSSDTATNLTEKAKIRAAYEQSLFEAFAAELTVLHEDWTKIKFSPEQGAKVREAFKELENAGLV